MPSVGSNSNYTILNVLGSALSNRRYIVDPLDCGRENTEYYSEEDLSIGGGCLQPSDFCPEVVFAITSRCGKLLWKKIASDRL